MVSGMPVIHPYGATTSQNAVSGQHISFRVATIRPNDLAEIRQSGQDLKRRLRSQARPHHPSIMLINQVITMPANQASSQKYEQESVLEGAHRGVH